MSNSVSLESLKYYTSKDEFLMKHSAPWTETVLRPDYTTIVSFAAVMAFNDATQKSEGWGFFVQGDHQSCTFSLMSCNESAWEIRSEVDRGGFTSPERLSQGARIVIGRLSDSAIIEQLRKHTSTCIETMWSKIYNADDQLMALRQAAALPRLQAVESQSQPEARWRITDNLFSAFHLMTGRADMLKALVDDPEKALEIQGEKGPLYIDAATASEVTNDIGSKSAFFVQDPKRFPGLLLTRTDGLITLHETNPSETMWMMDFSMNPIRMHRRKPDAAWRHNPTDLRVKMDALFTSFNDLEEIPPTWKSFVDAFWESEDQIIPAMELSMENAAIRCSFWNTVQLGAQSRASPLQLSTAQMSGLRGPVARGAAEQNWVPGTELTGPSCFEPMIGESEGAKSTSPSQ